MKVIIIIILIIIIIIISFNNIIYERFINTNQILCNFNDNNMDNACNTYNQQKSLLNNLQNNYNLAKKNTEDKYDLWNFSKREVLLKKAALDQAIVIDTILKNKNDAELLSKIILSIIYLKALITVINYQYAETSSEYIDAINNYNSSAGNANLLQLNNFDGYNSPSEALIAAITAYNTTVAIIPNTNNLMPALSIDTAKNILENTFIASKNLLININQNYLIPALAEYNNLATAANITNYDINSDLSSLKTTTQSQYDLANTNKETKIQTALVQYKSAAINEKDKLILFFNLITQLKSQFLLYINHLINPENGYDNNVIPSGTTKCDTYNNLITSSATNYGNLLTLNINKTVARNNSTQHPIKNNVDNNLSTIETIYNNLLQAFITKRNMLDAINLNDENTYSKHYLMHVSSNFDVKYSEYISANDQLLNIVDQYNNTSEKRIYNSLSMQYINTNVIYLNAMADIKRCYVNTDRAKVKI
jgi:hypothetical protein